MDERDLERTLVNLGVNSIHTVGEQGTVTLQVRELRGVPRVRIEVEDDGTGMSRARSPRYSVPSSRRKRRSTAWSVQQAARSRSRSTPP